MCGYAFERRGQLAETHGKCPNCGVILEIPARGESVEDDREPPVRPSGSVSRPRRPASGNERRRVAPWAWIALALVAVAAVFALGQFLPSDPATRPEVAGETRSDESSPEEAKERPSLDERPEPDIQAPPFDDKPDPDIKPPSEEETSAEERPGAENAPDSTALPEGEPEPPPTPRSPSTIPEPRKAQSLEEVLRAIVKFEVPLAGGARMQYGSGFLVDRRGWIATSNHVVASATAAARATFADGSKHALAGVVARAPERDLAIVKLANPPAELTILDIGYEPNPRLGSQVYAFGHPYNADFSLSKGIVSRVLTTADLLSGSVPRVVASMKAPKDLIWIQHDAKISPGNSGGPLLSDDGRVMGINAFVHVKAGFGYAGHVKYLRQLLATATEEVTPFPAAPAPGTAPTPNRPGQVVVSVGRMRQLYDAGHAFAWTPERPEQYQTLAELAKQMSLAKFVQARPQAANAPPEAVQNLVRFSDQIFVKMRTAGWGPSQSQAINRFAVDRLDKPGEGAMVFTTVVGNVRNALLLLEVQGARKYVLVPVGNVLSKSPRGTRWLLIARISSKTARLTTPTQSTPQRLPVLETHYMLRID